MRYVVLLLLILVGCRSAQDERERLFNYKCTVAQSDEVRKIYINCNDSGYLSSACYLHATKSICEYVGPK